MKKVLLLVYNKKFALFPYVKSEHIEINEVWKLPRYNGCFLVRMLSRTRFLYLVFLPFFLADWKNRISEYDKIIIFDSAYCNVLGNWLKNKIPQNKCYIYMWDGGNRRRLQDTKMFQLLSYNRDDARNGIKYNPLFYTDDIKPDIKINPKNDIFVCMHGDLSRAKEINRFCSWMEREGFRTDFHVIADEHTPDLEWEFKNRGGKDYIEYGEVIRLSQNSRAILEIGHSSEKGATTLRALEALFLERKLITTNERIAEMDFYDDKWIYILNENSMDATKLKEFLDNEEWKPSQEYKKYYNIDMWIERMS